MTFVTMDMPKGFRPMNDRDMQKLSWGAMVTILDTHDGSTALGHVHSESTSHVIVRLRGGAEILLDRASSSSPDEQFVALTMQLADELDDPNNAMAVALRASNAIARLQGRCRKLEEALHQQANAIQGMVSRTEYEALMADVSQLQQDYRILRMVKAS